MGNIVSIIWALALAVIWFIKYLKYKKIYWLLAIITACIMIYINTPFASGISKTFENMLVGILAMLLIIIFHLILKDDKEKVTLE